MHKKWYQKSKGAKIKGGKMYQMVLKIVIKNFVQHGILSVETAFHMNTIIPGKRAFMHITVQVANRKVSQIGDIKPSTVGTMVLTLKTQTLTLKTQILILPLVLLLPLLLCLYQSSNQ